MENEAFGDAEGDISEDVGGYIAVDQALTGGVAEADASENKDLAIISLGISVWQGYAQAWQGIAQNVLLGAAGGFLGEAAEGFAAADEGVAGAESGAVEDLSEDESQLAEECEGGCFVAGTDVLSGDRKTEEAIQDIQVGQRVATDGGVANSPNGTAAADPNSTQVDPKTWRLVTMEMEEQGPNGAEDIAQIQALEPLSELAQENAKVGSLVTVPLDLQEMGLPDDPARIISIGDCPTIQSGPGPVVLTTVTHLSNFVFDLTMANGQGQSETLGITGFHPVYTEDRGWVEASQLRTGEQVRGADGDLTVTALVRDPGVYQVYNMTVETDHVYYVGDLPALVHNNCLRSNMEDNGTEFEGNEDAHHIVAQFAPGMDEARDLLQQYDIDINDPINGVPLDWVFHQTVVHGADWPEYAETVTSILGDAADIGGKQGIIDALQSIAQILQGGNLP